MDSMQLRQNIIDELEFEPSLDPANIGVAVENGGVVTLSGHVSSYAAKLAAERAARKVKGVHAIAQEIEVRYPFDKKTGDDEIAKRAVNILKWDALVPPGLRADYRAKGMGDPLRRSQLAISAEGCGGRRPSLERHHRRIQQHLAQAGGLCLRCQAKDRERASSTREG